MLPSTLAHCETFPLRGSSRRESGLSFDKWAEVYKPLAKGPFVSPYASQGPEQDFAEFVAFYHLTQKMHLPYRITIHRDFPKEETLLFEWEPMKSPLVRDRFGSMEEVYR